MIFKKSKIDIGLGLAKKQLQAGLAGTSRDCLYLGKCDVGDNPKLDNIIDDRGTESCEVIYSKLGPGLRMKKEKTNSFT